MTTAGSSSKPDSLPSLNDLLTAATKPGLPEVGVRIPDQGLVELALTRWAGELARSEAPPRRLLVLSSHRKELQSLETVLQVNLPELALATLRFPGLGLWGANRYANQALQHQQRLEALYCLLRRASPAMLLGSLIGLGQRTMAPDWLARETLTVRQGEERDPDQLLTELADRGYSESELVNEPGTLAIRGGILDVFPTQSRWPVRLEFFGDLVESIRLFDPDSQRSLNELAEIDFFVGIDTPTPAARRLGNAQLLYETLLSQECDPHERQGMVETLQKGYTFAGYQMYVPLFRGQQQAAGFDFLNPDDALLLLESKAQLIEHYANFLTQAQQLYEADRASGKPGLAPADHFLSVDELSERLAACPRLIELGGADSPAAGDPGWQVLGRGRVEPQTRAHLRFEGEDAFDQLVALYHESPYQLVIAVHEMEHSRRVASLLEHKEIPVDIRDIPLSELLVDTVPAGVVVICQGHLSEWLFWEDRYWLMIPEFLLFGRRSPRPPRLTSQRQIQSLLSSFRDLEVGSAVVHIEHGIGRYQGIQTLSVQGVENDFLIIEYAGQDKVYVPVDRLNLVQKYAGGEGAAQPPLDRLKSQGWVKRKSKVKKAVAELADKLMRFQAQRKLARGPRLSDPGDLYYQFEGDFPFDETEDQWQAIDDVNKDLSGLEPMDRLVCGDVGFGKTEVALRAAMRAVVDGWQVMVLAPTTVLSFQHYKTFWQRFDKYRVRVGLLNRFVSAKQVTQARKDFADGRLDILIGTHRILSKDVKPKHLGLVVVDEEQRFGVTHKEAIKSLRAGCHVLTLTATPIPRSLHMAMLGLRNISIISTPPVERLAIRTYVAQMDEELIRQGVERELQRGGQVFFVHNRVENILQMREFLGEILPGVEIRVAHGQMREHELERVMVNFIEGKFPMLLCTTIIESGLDIPNVNTIFVNRAENFGLAQLYQMRGRVGRSSRQSYAYFLTRSDMSLNPDAARRLELLAAHQELGSGFQIANYDLEMRGAGNLLGGEQSGHVADVGLELYTEMLQEEIEKLQGETPVTGARLDTELKIPVTATIPKSYVTSENQRLSLYKSLFSEHEIEQVQALRRDTRDRFGPMPISCERIFKIAELKILLGQIKASVLSSLQADRYEIRFHSLTESEIATIADACGRDSQVYELRPDFSLVVNLQLDASCDDQETLWLEQLTKRIEPLSFHMTKAHG